MASARPYYGRVTPDDPQRNRFGDLLHFVFMRLDAKACGGRKPRSGIGKLRLQPEIGLPGMGADGSPPGMNQ